MAGKVVLKKKEGPRAPEIGEVIVTCPGGAEKTVRDELASLGYSGPKTAGGAVGVTIAGWGDVARINGQLRSASRVLVPLAKFDASDYDDVYRNVRAYPWNRLITPDHTFMISALSRSEELRDHRFLAMRVKDGIVDCQRHHFQGRRSSIEKETPDLVLSVFASGRSVELAVDSSGRPLHERGYRTEAGEAPLRENVAAMMLLEAGYHGGDRRMVFDPFCGSGTLLIEAALIHTERAVGSLGRDFAWRRWPWKEAVVAMGETYAQLTAAGTKTVPEQTAPFPRFVGCDRDAAVVEKARRNAKRAGVDHLVHFETADIAESIPKWTRQRRGLIISNPPYGVRLQPDDLAGLYSRTGELLRKHAGGWEVVLISGDPGLANRLRMRSETRQKIFNGSLECSLDFYRVYSNEGPGMKGIAHDS